MDRTQARRRSPRASGREGHRDRRRGRTSPARRRSRRGPSRFALRAETPARPRAAPPGRSIACSMPEANPPWTGRPPRRGAVRERTARLRRRSARGRVPSRPPGRRREPGRAPRPAAVGSERRRRWRRARRSAPALSPPAARDRDRDRGPSRSRRWRRPARARVPSGVRRSPRGRRHRPFGQHRTSL